MNEQLNDALIRIGELEDALACLGEENQRLELALAKALSENCKKKKRDMWSEPLPNTPRVKRSMPETDIVECGPIISQGKVIDVRTAATFPG